MIFPIRSLHISLELTKLFGFVRQYNYSRVALRTDIFLDFKMGISLKIRSYLYLSVFSVSYQFRNRSTSIQDEIPDLLNTWGSFNPSTREKYENAWLTGQPYQLLPPTLRYTVITLLSEAGLLTHYCQPRRRRLLSTFLWTADVQ